MRFWRSGSRCLRDGEGCVQIRPSSRRRPGPIRCAIGSFAQTSAFSLIPLMRMGPGLRRDDGIGADPRASLKSPPQLRLLHLAHCIARQALDEVHSAGVFEAGEPFADPSRDIALT